MFDTLVVIQPIMLIQDKMKQEKNELKENELVYSSFSAKKEEYASAARILFLLFINITQHTTITAINK